MSIYLILYLVFLRILYLDQEGELDAFDYFGGFIIGPVILIFEGADFLRSKGLHIGEIDH